MDDTTAIVQFHHNDIDIGATVESYAEAIKQQGFPEVDARLLEELRAWCEAEAGDEGALAPTIERVLEVEGEVLEDASVAGIAAEHLPFLYTVVGQVFKTGGPAFQKALLRQARQAEQAYEEAIRQHMRETDCDRLVAVQYMESVALERLQERNERLRAMVESHLS